jgi:NAD(P)-dependent dehydrogenase (short-subunit alcohol dehydrogenase family)
MNQNAIVTGAGSGVGRAIALALFAKGWRLALVGRRRPLLEETARLGRVDRDRFLVAAGDVGRSAVVRRWARRIHDRFGQVQVLINSAGTNVPRRSLEVLSPEDYHAMIDTNLHGAYYWVQAVLPSMRRLGQGTIVNVVSDAGKQASPKAGPAYVMSKFGLAGLTQSINAEERGRGIRACAIFPGDIDTPLLDKRPQPPPAEARAGMLRPEDVAACILLAIELPPRVVVEELIVRPR